MPALKSRTWILAKGAMLLAIAAITAVLIFVERPSVTLAALLAVLVWASCRFYYFLFHALEHYVDPTMRYSGLLHLLVALARRSRERPGR
jgi:hypothetical protein